jgi:hypothetical protein
MAEIYRSARLSLGAEVASAYLTLLADRELASLRKLSVTSQNHIMLSKIVEGKESPTSSGSPGPNQPGKRQEQRPNTAVR